MKPVGSVLILILWLCGLVGCESKQTGYSAPSGVTTAQPAASNVLTREEATRILKGLRFESEQKLSIGITLSVNVLDDESFFGQRQNEQSNIDWHSFLVRKRIIEQVQTRRSGPDMLAANITEYRLTPTWSSLSSGIERKPDPFGTWAMFSLSSQPELKSITGIRQQDGSAIVEAEYQTHQTEAYSYLVPIFEEYKSSHACSDNNVVWCSLPDADKVNQREQKSFTFAKYDDGWRLVQH